MTSGRRKDALEGAVKTLLDAGILAGTAVFIYGLYLIYHPLAPIAGGLLFAGGCFFVGYDKMRRSQR